MSNYAIASIVIVAIFAIIGCIVIINARNKRGAPSWEREKVNDYIEQLRQATARDIPGHKWRQPVIRNLTGPEILNAINMPRQPDDPGTNHNINAFGAAAMRAKQPPIELPIEVVNCGLTQTPPPAPVDTVTPGAPIAYSYCDNKGREWVTAIPFSAMSNEMRRSIVAARVLWTSAEYDAEIARLNDQP